VNPLLLSEDETEALGDATGSPPNVPLSSSEVAINHWIDIAEAWLDRYIVTPLLGPGQSGVR
jgi:hypothetical protein